MLESLLKKVPEACNFIERRLRHRAASEFYDKFLGTNPEILGGMKKFPRFLVT